MSDFSKYGYQVLDIKDSIINNYVDKDFMNIHENIKDINEYRLGLISKFNNDDLHKKIAQSLNAELINLLGPDLAIQRSLNVTVQTPENDEGILAEHSDTWCGNSHYEIVIWVPLTTCVETRSMYVYDLSYSLSFWKDYIKGNKKMSDLDRKEKKYIEINPGQALIFSPNLIHGSDVNETTETRVSLNFRMKNLFSPYGDKDLFNYFENFSRSSVTELSQNFLRCMK